MAIHLEPNIYLIESVNREGDAPRPPGTVQVELETVEASQQWPPDGVHGSV